MKKNIKIIPGIAALIGLLAIAVVGCTSSSGSSDDESTTVDGSVVKGYVRGATVFADKVIPGNRRLDDGEASDASDENGDYDFEVSAEYGEYQLATTGGTIIGTGEPAPPMLAPMDADNITPVTTIVALRPELREKIGALYDQDIADEAGANSVVLAMAMAIKTCLNTLTNAVSMTESQQLSVISAMADAFNDLSTAEFKEPGKIATATKTAVETVAQDEAVFSAAEITFDSAALAEAIQTAVANVVATIDVTSEIPVLESVVEAVVVEEVAKVTEEVEAAITKIAKVSISNVKFNDAQGTTLDTIYSSAISKNLTRTNAAATTALACNMWGRNDFGEHKNYSNAQLIIEIKDSLSTREATVTVSGVNVTITPCTQLPDQSINCPVTLAFGATSTKLHIEGVDAAGNAVIADISNTSVEGDTAIVSFSGNVATLHLNALDAKIESVTGAEAIFDIGRTGKFEFNMSASVVPLLPSYKAINVE